MCVEQIDWFRECGHKLPAVITICNIYANMVDADPLGAYIPSETLPIYLCPAYRFVRAKWRNYCDDCDAKMLEEFEKEKEEAKKKKAENGGSEGSGESWQLVVQAPPEADS
ncbi:hypothetical protein TWF281_011122 [Arthrobotrys megalospora]